jgi:hypothetical protein
MNRNRVVRGTEWRLHREPAIMKWFRAGGRHTPMGNPILSSGDERKPTAITLPGLVPYPLYPQAYSRQSLVTATPLIYGGHHLHHTGTRHARRGPCSSLPLAPSQRCAAPHLLRAPLPLPNPRQVLSSSPCQDATCVLDAITNSPRGVGTVQGRN